MRKKIITIFIIMLIFATITTVADTKNIEIEKNCESCRDPGDICFVYDVETPTDDNQCVGVEFDGTYFYITGGGGTTHPDTNYVYFFDVDGNYLSQAPQPTTSDWGWRDIAFDGTYMYSSDSANVDVWHVTGLPMSPVINVVSSFPGPENPNRAMAYDPATGHFWTANRESSIYEFDNTGTVINTYSNVKRIYSMAWDDQCFEDSMLWIYDQTDEGGNKCHIRQFDPLLGIYTGLEFTGVHNDSLNDVAGGSCFINDFGGKSVFIGLTQNTPDQIFCMEMCEPGAPVPLICCDPMEMDWDNVKPGATVEGSFHVWNCGDPGSTLNWEVDLWPLWMENGSVAFVPSSGSEVHGGPGTQVDFTFTAPSDINTNFAGTVTIINVENPSDYCEMDTTLVTPRAKGIFFNILEQLANRFPILQMLLQK
jgi:hypothetical protein